MGAMALHITGDPAADQLLSDDAFALLTGMLLDQQVPMETAFAGPLKIRERLGTIDPAAIADHAAVGAPVPGVDGRTRAVPRRGGAG
jgi:uncharacterized HhH-GPD family protein